MSQPTPAEPTVESTSEPATTFDAAVSESKNAFTDSIDSYFNNLGNDQSRADEPDGPDEAAETSVTDDSAVKTEAPEKTEASEKTEAPEKAEASEKAEPELSDLDSIDEDVKDWTPQAARRFKELKASLKAAKEKLATYESASKQAESRTQELEALADNPEYEELRRRVDEYESKMLVSRLEDTYAYKTLVGEPIKRLVATSDAIAAKYEVDNDALLDAIALTDEAAQEEQLTELLSEVGERDKFRIYQIIEDLKPILAQRQALYENAEAALAEAEALEEERNKADLAAKARARQQAAEVVSEKLTSKLSFLTSIEGLDMAALTKDSAAIDPASLDPIEGTYQAMAGKLLPKIAGLYINMQRELDNLTDKLAQYDEAQPRAGRGGAGTRNAAGGRAAQATSFADAVNAAFGGL